MKKVYSNLFIGFIIGIVFAFVVYKQIMPLCAFDGTPAGFYCEDWFQLGSIALSFAIPILISYWVSKKNM